MVKGWIIPAVGGAFTTAWTYHEGKFIGLPKMDKKLGIGVSIGLFLLSAWLYKKEHMGGGILFHVPPVPRIPEYVSNYAHNPAIGPKPLGSYTGPGLTTDRNKPASAIAPFPDNVARAQTYL